MKYKNFIKRVSVAVLLLTVSLLGVSAQEGSVSVSIDKFFISPGETKTVYLNMDNTEKVRTIDVYVVLPDGLSFVSMGEGTNYKVCDVSADRCPDHMIQLTGVKDDAQKAHLIITGEEPVKGNTGALCSFDVTAAANIPVTSSILLTGLEAVYSGNIFTADDTEGEVINAENKIDVTLGDLTIAAGETKTVAVNVENGGPVNMLQCDVILPAGLTIDLESLTKSDRLNNAFKFKPALLDGNCYRLIVWSMAAEFEAGSGALYTFSLTAGEDIAETGEVKVCNIVGVALDETPYYGPDVVSAVTKDTTTGINGVDADSNINAKGIYTVGGVRTDRLTKGVNIVRKADGTTVKVIKK